MPPASGFVYGIHAVEALLKQRPQDVSALWVQRELRNPRVQKLLARAQDIGLRILTVPAERLAGLAPEARHQGVAAECRAEPAAREDLATLIDAMAGPALLLVLDGVQDPHNLGACLRSAEAAGAHALIAPRDRAAGLTATACKVACGAAERVPFFAVTNLARSLRELRAAGVWLYGAVPDAGAPWHEIDLTGPVALVLGAEAGGLRRLTRELCDGLIRIPMAGAMASLNVSVASGILLFEAVRQRRARNSAALDSA